MRRVPKARGAGQAQLITAVNSAARAALEVAREWKVPVFPCESASKQPLTEHGFHDASADPAQIAAWWTEHPQALIGVPTGAPSGLVAVDVDPKGVDWYQAHKGRLGAHRLHRTRRGRHLLYQSPATRVRNSTDQVSTGIDVRGEGGYVIWWPAHGGAAAGQPGEMPDWLVRRVRTQPRKLNGHAPAAGGLSEAQWTAERPRIYAALSQLDPDCAHDDWRDVGMALSWATDGEADGAELFLKWSRGDLGESGRAVKFPGDVAVARKYASFKNEKAHNITLATLYQQLKKSGRKVPAGRPEKKPDNKDVHVSWIRADEIEEKAVDWLWKGYLARNKFHLLTGSGGVMKSTLTMALAATITRGGQWPDGTSCERPLNVIFWTGEDDLADTVRPRLRFAGADLRKCYFINGVREKGQKRRDFDPALDMEALERMCAEIGDIALIIIDPIVSIVQKDNNSASDVRRALAPVISLGTHYNTVILGLQHFTKGSKGKDPTERVLGSGAWTQAARIVLAAAAVDEGDGKVANRMVFACTKTFHKAPGGFEYGYEEEASTEIARVVWGKHLEGTAHAIFQEAEGDADGKSKLGIAKSWLLNFLSTGPKAMLSIGKQADIQGIRGITLRRAREGLRVVSSWRGRERFWALPEAE